MIRVRCFDCPLRCHPAFKSLTESQIALIDEIKRDHLYLPAGTEIIHPGQENAELYTLFAGWAFRYKMLPDGRRQILNFMLPGDLVGLQAAMFDAALYGVESLTAIELCLLPRRRFWTLYERMPELAFDVTWLGAREEALVDDNLLSAGRRSAAERIAALVIGLFKRAEAIGLVAPDRSFEFPINQTHIADALGLSLVHTNKTLASLRRRGLFSGGNGRLRIDNPYALQSVAQHFDQEPIRRPMI